MSNDDSQPPYSPTDRSWLDRPPQPPTDSGISSGRCAMFGCLGLFVGGMLLILCAGFGTYYIIAKQVEKYTDTAPADIPTIDYAPEQLEQLQSKIAEFRTVLEGDEAKTHPGANQPKQNSKFVVADDDSASKKSDAGIATDPKTQKPIHQPPRELVLSSDDINAMVAQEESLRGRVYIRVEEGKISGEISIPIESAIPGSKGRYLNGTGTFDVSLENGVLTVYLEEATVKGEPLPEELLKAMRTENLAKDVYRNPKNAEMMRRFESIRVEDDRVIVNMK